MRARRRTVVSVTSRLTLCCAIVFCSAVTAGRTHGAMVSIEAGDPASSFKQLVKQTGVQLLYEPEVVEGRTTQAVAGDLNASKALELMLAGTGLTFTSVNASTIVIRQPHALQSGPKRLINDNANSSGGLPVPENVTPQRRDKEQAGVPEIVIKGAKSLNTDIRRGEDDPQPYVVFTRKEIERTGARSVEDFLRQQLTADASNVGNLLSASSTSPVITSSINLRGLGSGQTLILVDGRRLAGPSDHNGGTLQPDINGIPLSAIERIEVLPTTASGIYGGSATGGVINIVLRRDYSGFETKLSYGNTFDAVGRTRSIDVSGGLNLEGGRTNVIFAGALSDGEQIFLGDRRFVQRAREHIVAKSPFGYGALAAPNPPSSATTNIQSSDGSNLRFKPAFGGAVLPSSRTFVPYGYAGPSSDGGTALGDNAGSFNLDLAPTLQVDGKDRAVASGPTFKSIMTSARRQFSSWLAGFVDGSIARTKTVAEGYGNSGTATFNLAGSAPQNPFTNAIRVTVPLSGISDARRESEYRSNRIALGAIATLSDSWSASADFTWNETEQRSTAYRAFDATSARTAVSNGLTPDGAAFDVFADASALDFGRFVLPMPINVVSPSKATSRDLAFRASGPLPWIFPGERPTLSAVIERHWDRVDPSLFQTSATVSILAPSVSQAVNSAYLELLWPIVSRDAGVSWAKRIDLQIAGRFDDYKTSGSSAVVEIGGVPTSSPIPASNRTTSVDPTVAMKFQPADDVTLRASYGTGFLPPGPNQLSTTSTVVTNAGGLTDPLRGNELLGSFADVEGGNSSLRPETSVNRSAGLVLTPRIVPNLRLSVDWTKITKKDGIANIVSPDGTLQGLLDAYIQVAPERLARAAPSDGFAVGPILAWDATLLNISSLKVTTWDYAVDYLFTATQLGSITWAARATQLSHSQSQVTPLAPLQEFAGTSVAVKWRATTSLQLEHRNWTVSWTTRWLDRYFLDISHALVPNQGAATVPSQIYHDLLLAYRPGGGSGVGRASGVLKGMEFQLGLTNVFDRKPPIDVNAPYYYSLLGDPRLASYYFSMKKSF